MSETNGTGNGHATLEALREQYERADLELKALQARRAAAALGQEVVSRRRAEPLTESILSAGWLGPWYDLFDRYRSGFSAATFFPGVADYQDHRWGQNWPVYRSEQDLNILRQPARVLAASNSATIGLLGGLADYVVGTGYSYKVAPRPGAGDLPPGLLAAAQRVVDDFLERNQWQGGEKPSLERECLKRYSRDGEAILCLFARPDGTTAVRGVWPEQLTQPPGALFEEYGFGVWADPDDPEEPGAYWVRYGDSPAEGEEYSPGEVIHLRNNVDRGVKRGVTDFFADAYTCLRGSSTIREALTEAATQQAGIVGVRQHKGASATQIGDFAARRASYTVPDPWTGELLNVRRERPGRWEDVGENSAYVDGPSAANVPNHVQVLSECHRAGGRRYRAPDWLIGGNADSANFATSLTEESPFVRAVIATQAELGGGLRLGPWRALENWCRARGGLALPGGQRVPWALLRRLVDVVATPPTAAVRNRKEEMDVNTGYVALGVKSRRQVAEEQGWDYEKAQAELAKEQPPGGGPAGSGPQNDGRPPEGAPPGGGGDREPQRTSAADRPDADAEPGAPAGLAEQTEHGKGGQFAPGGGRVAASAEDRAAADHLAATHRPPAHDDDSPNATARWRASMSAAAVKNALADSPKAAPDVSGAPEKLARRLAQHSERLGELVSRAYHLSSPDAARVAQSHPGGPAALAVARSANEAAHARAAGHAASLADALAAGLGEPPADRPLGKADRGKGLVIDPTRAHPALAAAVARLAARLPHAAHPATGVRLAVPDTPAAKAALLALRALGVAHRPDD